MAENPVIETRPSVSLHTLVVDDDADVLSTLADALREEGYEVDTAQDGAQALGKLESGPFDLVVTDIRMPHIDGMALFERLREFSPRPEVILITGQATVPEAVAAMQRDAANYLPKPFTMDQLLAAVAEVAERRDNQRRLSQARGALNAANVTGATRIVGESPPIAALRERIATIAQSATSVVITGESGTGKELVARAIHEQSDRRNGPFVAVNCAVFPENLLEAELFGHERGAFTGAERRRSGRFQTANGGTLFLDEVVGMPLLSQAKLLRVLQEGSFEPLGSDRTIEVDVRVLSACNVDLKTCVEDGQFREDLYYRLKVFQLEVPPLRHRLEDLPLLVAWFLDHKGVPGRRPTRLTARAWSALRGYDYPGNVRELEHAIEHAVVLASGQGANEIDLEHLPPEILEGPRAESDLEPLAAAVGDFERGYLIRALRRTGGHKTRAAELLEVSRKTLWLKLKRHGLV
jgi:two-component system, NtrC family, response regulator AtoC